MKIKLEFKKGNKKISVRKVAHMFTLLEYLSSGEYKEDLMEDELKYIKDAGYYLISVQDDDEAEDIVCGEG